MSEKFFLDQDDDGHWYVVPVNKMPEWDDWLNLDPDDPKSWSMPTFVNYVGGSPSLVTFTNPEIQL